MPRVPASERDFSDDPRVNRLPVPVVKLRVDSVNRRLTEIDTRLRGISTDGLNDDTLHAFVDAVLELESVREELLRGAAEASALS